MLKPMQCQHLSLGPPCHSILPHCIAIISSKPSQKIKPMDI
uniref:Uncharacterized protein n=1 Tax=Anguilla anguilla TaxID=7936 RepID=A0A0E9QTH7_ANGAN